MMDALHGYASSLYRGVSNLSNYIQDGNYTRHLYDSIGTSDASSAGPPFGLIAAIILGASIVGLIVATTRYNKFSFLPKM